MEQSTFWNVVKRLWVALCASLTMGVPAVADDSGAIRAVQMDPEKLAGVNLPAELIVIERDAYEQAYGTADTQ